MSATECTTVEQNRFREAFGHPKERTATKVRPWMSPYLQAFIARSPFVVVATSDAQGHCDASPKGGGPGFVRILDERHLLLPDAAGNNLFHSYQNLDVNPHVGLIFFIPGVDDCVRVNGKAAIVDKEEVERHCTDLSPNDSEGGSKYRQGIVIEVEEAYRHCPKAMKFGKLWDVQEITANKAERPVPDRSADL